MTTPTETNRRTIDDDDDEAEQSNERQNRTQTHSDDTQEEEVQAKNAGRRMNEGNLIDNRERGERGEI